MKIRLGERRPPRQAESVTAEGVDYSSIEAGIKASATFKTKTQPRIVFANAEAMAVGQ
jgi:hypothetical protein